MPSIRNLAIGTISHHDSDGKNMIVTATIREPGVLTYLNKDGSTRNEYVPPGLLRHVDSEGGGEKPLIAGIAKRPATSEHPPVFLRENKQYKDAFGKGVVLPTGIKVFKDGETEIMFEVADSELQDDIRSGRKRGVSLGYECGSRPFNDSIDGKFVHFEQTLPFKFDHVAVCANPRAKGALIKRFDSIQMEEQDIAFHVDTETSKQFYMGGGRKVATIRLGNATYELEDSSVASNIQNYTDSLHADMDKMKKELEEEKEGHDDAVTKHNELVDSFEVLEAAHDTAKEKIDSLEAERKDSGGSEEAAQRIDAWMKCMKIAGCDRIDAELKPFEVKADAMGIDSKLNVESIYRGYLATRTDSDYSKKSATYIEGRIDSLIEDGVGDRTDSTTTLLDTLNNSKKRKTLRPAQRIRQDSASKLQRMSNMSLKQAVQAHGGN